MRGVKGGGEAEGEALVEGQVSGEADPEGQAVGEINTSLASVNCDRVYVCLYSAHDKGIWLHYRHL